MIKFEHVNPDAMNKEDLQDLSQQLKTNQDEAAVKAFFGELVKSLENPLEIYNLVERYCRLKAWAMSCRIKGYISEASMIESVCDEAYKKMPEIIRW